MIALRRDAFFPSLTNGGISKKSERAAQENHTFDFSFWW